MEGKGEGCDEATTTNANVSGVFMDQQPKDVIVQDDQKEALDIQWVDEDGRIYSTRSAFATMHDFIEMDTPILAPGTKIPDSTKRLKPMLGDRKLTTLEVSRLIHHKLHVRMGELKQRKLMQQHHEDLKVNQMDNSDTPSSLSVERMTEDFPTPMLGDTKVEHLLGIKQKSEPGDMGSPKKPPKT